MFFFFFLVLTQLFVRIGMYRRTMSPQRLSWCCTLLYEQIVAEVAVLRLKTLREKIKLHLAVWSGLYSLRKLNTSKSLLRSTTPGRSCFKSDSHSLSARKPCLARSTVIWIITSLQSHIQYNSCLSLWAQSLFISSQQNYLLPQLCAWLVKLLIIDKVRKFDGEENGTKP